MDTSAVPVIRFFPLVNVDGGRSLDLIQTLCYGPIPRLRTGRVQNGRSKAHGMMSWTWQDEYTEDRKGTSQYFQKNKIFL